MGRITIFSLSFLCIAIVITLIGCSTRLFTDKSPSVANGAVKVTPDNHSQTTPARAQPQISIRSVDFSNSTYPWPEDLLVTSKQGQKTFRFTNGKLAAARD